jgi:acetyl esterase
MPIEPAITAALARAGVTPPTPASDPVRQRQLALDYELAIYDHVALRAPETYSQDHVLPVKGHPDVLVRLYYPAKPEPQTRYPVCLAFFGGAFRQGGLSHPAFAETCKLRAHRAGVVIAAVSYALAPEHHFPTPVEQGYAVLEWLVDQGTSVGVDPTRIGVNGGSSGGNIAAALTLMNRDRAHHRLAVQILEVPALDLTGGSLDWSALDGPLRQLAPELERELRSVVDTYVPERADQSLPYASPLLAADHKGLPPAYIFTAENDPLRGDGERYAAVLAAADVPVAAVRLIGHDHGSAVFEKVTATARMAQATVAAALRSLHEERSDGQS